MGKEGLGRECLGRKGLEWGDLGVKYRERDGLDREVLEKEGLGRADLGGDIWADVVWLVMIWECLIDSLCCQGWPPHLGFW